MSQGILTTKYGGQTELARWSCSFGGKPVGVLFFHFPNPCKHREHVTGVRVDGVGRVIVLFLL
jgi:hypothetical protein